MERNIRLVMEYDGAAYSGFQLQAGVRTIQGELEKALLSILKEPVRVTGAGRTDAGVHALGQVVNFRTSSRIPVDKFPLALNSILPPDIRIIDASEVDVGFHARYDAKSKVYCYKIQIGPHASAFLRNYAYHVPLELDLDRMRAASECLVGRHDFRSFAASGGGAKTFEREVRILEWARDGRIITMTIEADGFLYNMVRIIVGTVLRVGSGREAPEWVKGVLDARDRRVAGPTAPARGLYLVCVRY
ncbi:MAG: tRNA pseudouridine(38-40) synthase TruA [Firmicutes bacterium]|nr:tRNA pseudouridine(38-40) synthase TruA [Bacillota bacterium]